MSILDSATDVAEARERLAAKDEEGLRADLVYWNLAAVDHQRDWRELTERRAAVGALHAEAAGMASLVIDELAKRRDAAKADGPVEP